MRYKILHQRNDDCLRVTACACQRTPATRYTDMHAGMQYRPATKGGPVLLLQPHLSAGRSGARRPTTPPAPSDRSCGPCRVAAPAPAPPGVREGQVLFVRRGIVRLGFARRPRRQRCAHSHSRAH